MPTHKKVIRAWIALDPNTKYRSLYSDACGRFMVGRQREYVGLRCMMVEIRPLKKGKK